MENLLNKLGLNRKTEEYLNSHLNDERKEKIKAMMLYPFIEEGFISYDEAAKILDIDVNKLFSIYDYLGCSTNAYSYSEIKEKFITSGIMTKEQAEKADKEFKELEYEKCEKNRNQPV